MDAISYKELNADLARHLDDVVERGTPLVVKRGAKKSVVVMPLDEFRSWKETAYLLSTPANARSLLESIAQVTGGKLLTKDGELA
jgi:antitoxin YefM